MATRRRPRRTAAPGDAGRGRAAARGAHLGAGRARRPRPRHARRAGCRHPGRLPDRTSPAGPGRGARRPWPRRATGRPRRAVRRTFHRGHREGTDRRPGRRPRGLGGRRRRARVDWPALWLHGDLHPAILTVDGAFCDVIDFGDLCAGDPACDLAASWVLLPTGPGRRGPAPGSRLGGAASPQRHPHRRGLPQRPRNGCLRHSASGVRDQDGSCARAAASISTWR
ncbi:phosphotransferase [Streptomyces shenzhenensis]|uniref:phosphotransferase n=1 Tax=Streptomyces shenzhenensis TaxID=943815 RepID=UPI003D8BFCB7